MADQAARAVLVRYFAAAEEAAGCAEETLADAPATVADLRSLLVERYGAAMARVLDVGSLIVDGIVTRDPARSIQARVDVLPPFSGG